MGSDKAGLVLRIETVIKNHSEFRVPTQVPRDGKQRTQWVEVRKGAADLLRYRKFRCRPSPVTSMPWPCWTTPRRASKR